MKSSLGEFFFDGSAAGMVTFVVGVTALFIAPFVIVGLVMDHRHTEFLRINGCQLRTETETGRRVNCGKACTRPERMQIYDCAEGTRYEIDGRFLTGAGGSKAD